MMFKAFTSGGHGAPAWLGAVARRRSIGRRAIALAIAATLLSVGGAFAGNGAQTTQFAGSYDSFTCVGVRIVKSAPKAFTKDSETCTFTDLTQFPPGTYKIVDFWSTTPGAGETYWFSDYEILDVAADDPICVPDYPVCYRSAVSGTIVSTDNGDGTGTLTVTAYY
jgi:hypothetical protein